MNMIVLFLYLPTDAAQGRLNARDREVDAASAGVTPILHWWLRMVYTLLKQALYFPANKHFLNFDDELFNMEALRTEKRKLKVKIVCYPVFITGITYKLVWGGSF